jgi:hypothetical protein
MPQIQYQGIKGNTLDVFKDMNRTPVLYPANVKSGNVIYPYEKAK